MYALRGLHEIGVLLRVILDGNVFCYTRREPVGIVGAITPVSVLTTQE